MKNKKDKPWSDLVAFSLITICLLVSTGRIYVPSLIGTAIFLNFILWKFCFNFLQTRQQGSSFLTELKQKLLLPPTEAATAGTRYNVPLINSLVLYVGMQVLVSMQIFCIFVPIISLILEMLELFFFFFFCLESVL